MVFVFSAERFVRLNQTRQSQLLNVLAIKAGQLDRLRQ
jgi:hypothetical protein